MRGHCIFLWKNKENYLYIIPVTPSYPKHCNLQGISRFFEVKREGVDFQDCLKNLGLSTRWIKNLGVVFEGKKLRLITE